MDRWTRALAVMTLAAGIGLAGCEEAGDDEADAFADDTVTVEMDEDSDLGDETREAGEALGDAAREGAQAIGAATEELGEQIQEEAHDDSL